MPVQNLQSRSLLKRKVYIKKFKDLYELIVDIVKTWSYFYTKRRIPGQLLEFDFIDSI